MIYMFAAREGLFDKYISLVEVIEILSWLSKYSNSYIAGYLEYYGLHDKIQAYYIDGETAHILPIDNGSEVVLELLEITGQISTTVNITRDLPSDLVGRLGDISFIADDLNNSDIFYKFHNFNGFDFTDKERIKELTQTNFNAEQTVINEKLKELALNNQLTSNDIISIDKISELVGYTYHQIIIKNDNLSIVNVNSFSTDKNQYIPVIDGSKLTLKKPIRIDADLAEHKSRIAELEQRLSELQAKAEKLKTENEQLRQAKSSSPDDEDMNPKRLKSVTHLLNVLFYKANYNIEDAHSGTVNHKIVELSRDKISNKTQISKKTVSYWIQQVQQLRIDNEQQ